MAGIGEGAAIPLRCAALVAVPLCPAAVLLPPVGTTIDDGDMFYGSQSVSFIKLSRYHR